MPGLAAIEQGQPFVRAASHRLDDAVTDIAGAGDGSWSIAGTAAGRLVMFDAAGETVRSWQAHDGGVIRIRPQPDRHGTVASAGEDGRVVLWDCGKASETTCLLDEKGWVEHLEWTSDGALLAVAARKTLSLWRGADALGMWHDAKRQILALAWAPDGRRLATAANKGLYLWRIGPSAGQAVDPVQLLSFPGAPVSVAWQPNGCSLAVGTQDGFLQVWRSGGPERQRTASRGSQLTMKGYPSKVSCISWHPSRPVIASAGGPDVVLWQFPSKGGKAKGQPLRHHASTVTALGWGDDGRFLASGDRSGRLCIWNARGEPIFTQNFEHEITVMQWRSGGTALFVGDTAGGLHLLRHTNSSDQNAMHDMGSS